MLVRIVPIPWVFDRGFIRSARGREAFCEARRSRGALRLSRPGWPKVIVPASYVLRMGPASACLTRQLLINGADYELLPLPPGYWGPESDGVHDLRA